MKESRLLILDGHSLAFRAFYSRDPQNFKTSQGIYTNAVHGFASMIEGMIKKYNPSHIASAFDLSRHSFRTDIYPEYKAGRSQTPPEFSGQVDMIKELLEALGIRWITQENVEADDILATLAKKGSDEGMEVLVVSGDRDTFQLINDKVSVLYAANKFQDSKIMDSEAVEERYGVVPSQYPDLAAITGEKADNLPGVPGVGEKTAAAWLQKYGSLQSLIDNSAELKGKRGEDFRAHIDRVLFNRRLNRLRDDLIFDFSLNDLQWLGIHQAQTVQLCSRLEFLGIRRSLLKLPVNENEDTQIVVGPEIKFPRQTFLVNNQSSEKDIAKFLTFLDANNLSYIFALGNAHPVNSCLDLLFIGDLNECYVIDPTALAPKLDSALANWIARDEAKKILWRAKALWHMLHAQGYELRGIQTDLDLIDYLVDPALKRDDISEVILRLFGFELPEIENKGQVSLDLGLDNEQVITPQQLKLNYASNIIASLVAMHSVLEQKLQLRGGTELLNDIEMPCEEILTQMEHTGIGISTKVLEDLEKNFNQEVDEASQAAFKAIGRQVNLSSPKQLQEVLFDQLNLPPTKKNKTGYSTNAAALEELAIAQPHPFLDALLLHREKIKLAQIVTGLLKSVASDERIHSTFGQTITATGRLSSAEPNLQNIPARSKEGKAIRQAFVASAGFSKLLTADYSQIEMRIMAHLSQDTALIEAFNSGEDLHVSVAALVFGIERNQVSPQQRSQIKATSYGLAYGLSSYGLAKQLGVSTGVAKTLMDKYFERFGKVRQYLDEVVTQATSDGYTQTMYGRRRYLPELRSNNFSLRSAAQRAALNAPIQGSAADLIKLAMIGVQKALDGQKLYSRLVLQVHDELIVEVAPGEEEKVQSLVEKTMSGVAKLSVPLEVSTGIGVSWRDASH